MVVPGAAARRGARETWPVIVPLLVLVPTMATGPAASGILAHANGFNWDEAVMVLAPIVTVAALLALANKRAGALQDSDPAEPSEPSEPTATATATDETTSGDRSAP
jgi:hypothetical protein